MTIASKATHVLHSWHPVKLIATNKKKFKKSSDMPEVHAPTRLPGVRGSPPPSLQNTDSSSHCAHPLTSWNTNSSAHCAHLTTDQNTNSSAYCAHPWVPNTDSSAHCVHLPTGRNMDSSANCTLPTSERNMDSSAHCAPAPPLPHMASAWRQQHTHSSAQRPKRAPRWAPMVERLTKPPCWHHSACRNGAPQNSTAMAHLAEGGAGAWIEAWHHDSSKFCWWPFWKWGRRRANREPYILLTFFEPCIV